MESSEKESEEIIARTQAGGGWPLLFFPVCLLYMCTCHNFFKTSNGDAYILKGEMETTIVGEREREERSTEKEKECEDLFHSSAAFAMSLYLNK